ncbi:hypothetical protein PV325_008095 [Microctonus aethiopoides]|nr:hypothetical protein PV325_008095 [Microctonus aethiopoides]
MSTVNAQVHLSLVLGFGPSFQLARSTILSRHKDTPNLKKKSDDSERHCRSGLGSSVEVTGVDGAVDDAVEVDAEAGDDAEDAEAAVDAEVAEDEAEEAVKVQ